MHTSTGILKNAKKQIKRFVQRAGNFVRTGSAKTTDKRSSNRVAKK